MYFFVSFYRVSVLLISTIHLVYNFIFLVGITVPVVLALSSNHFAVQQISALPCTTLHSKKLGTKATHDSLSLQPLLILHTNIACNTDILSAPFSWVFSLALMPATT